MEERNGAPLEGAKGKPTEFSWRTFSNPDAALSCELGLTAPLWIEFFSTVQSGAILEIGAGRGDVSSIAVEVGRRLQSKFKVYATDIGPSAPNVAGAVGIAGISAEKLPLADGAAMAVFSQFGFEYAQRAPAIEEVGRVLAPGGRLCFLMHHRSSDLSLAVRHARSSLLAFERTGYFSAIVSGGPKSGSLAFTRAEERARTLVTGKAATSQVVERMAACAEIKRLIEAGEDSALDAVEHWNSVLATQLGLLDAQQSAALDREAAKEVARAFRRLGFNVLPPTEYTRDGKLIGWVVLGERLDV